MVFGRVAEDKEVTILRLKGGLDAKRSLLIYMYVYTYIYIYKYIYIYIYI